METSFGFTAEKIDHNEFAYKMTGKRGGVYFLRSCGNIQNLYSIKNKYGCDTQIRGNYWVGEKNGILNLVSNSIVYIVI